MTIRSASLCVLMTFAATLAPARAQQAPLPAEIPQAESGSYDGEWIGAWDDDAVYRGVWHGTYTGADGEPVEAEFRGIFLDDGHFLSDGGRALARDERGWREEQATGWRAGYRRSYQPAMLGYSPEERAEWLYRCRSAYTAPEQRDGDGRLIGAVVGAAAGGLIGNRVARGNRLLGTVIGAGAGGLAGAAIGDAADDAARRRDDRAIFDVCEDYLDRYERSYGGSIAGYGPVRWVRVPIRREPRDCACSEEDRY
ncbi:conserved hypothetical protein [Altererythrobacter sp. B11]|uniref:glycine zipper 2TM domain-containing protein n=1 Tax=Altererythrobacter sp. B11 TaxID=2060312 RepID=UPI000DC72F4A|nr:glycine zipper 2TM domain-containing protein [Altererythrobacter sp. B11]BBC71445.1 conserved hypothetical protein [Altererythrobacter sp. B11]